MRVIGTIVEEESGKPLAGLQVRAFDKDLLFDDKLGIAKTDAAGEFTIFYSEADFSSGLEKEPEIYVRVFDATGKTLLYSSEKSIRKHSLAVETFNIKIPKSKLA